MHATWLLNNTVHKYAVTITAYLDIMQETIFHVDKISRVAARLFDFDTFHPLHLYIVESHTWKQSCLFHHMSLDLWQSNQLWPYGAQKWPGTPSLQIMSPWILEQRNGLETCVGVEPNWVEILITLCYWPWRNKKCGQLDNGLSFSVFQLLQAHWKLCLLHVYHLHGCLCSVLRHVESSGTTV